MAGLLHLLVFIFFLLSMVMFDLNDEPPVEEAVEGGAGLGGEEVGRRGGEGGGIRPPPPDALVVGARARRTTDVVVLGVRRQPPLGMVGRPRGGFFCTSSETSQGLPPLGLVRRPRAIYTSSIDDAASDMLPSDLLGRTMPSFTIGTAGSEPVVPVCRVGLSRRSRGGGMSEAGSSRGGASNRTRGACSGLDIGSSIAGSSVQGLEQQPVHGRGTGHGSMSNLGRGAARPRRGRGSGKGTPCVQENGEGIGYAGGFDSNYT